MNDSRGDGPPPAPRWVKVFGGLLAIVVLVFVALMLVRGPGGHGPARHFRGDDTAGEARGPGR
jgi:hypothetical protein